MLAEQNSSGGFRSVFVWGEKPNTPEYLIRGGQIYKLIVDPRGSVRLVVNAETGEVVSRMSYDEFGRRLSGERVGFQPFQFAGGRRDIGSGLLQFGARHYDPVVGRWISKDPIGFDGGDTNLYGYVLNDPVNFVDPSGLLPNGVCVLLFTGGGLSAGTFVGSFPVGTMYGGLAGFGIGLTICPDDSKAEKRHSSSQPYNSPSFSYEPDKGEACE
tara:strand:- start:2345 stop:2986 length:642 start_codon:yes stop_codon:yes gene_type:complete